MKEEHHCQVKLLQHHLVYLRLILKRVYSAFFFSAFCITLNMVSILLSLFSVWLQHHRRGDQTYRGQLGGGDPDNIHQQEYHHPQSHPSPLGCRATLRAHPVHDEHPLHRDGERRNSETASLMTTSQDRQKTVSSEVDQL